ncbi:hypothetical protein BC939DRAFT_451569, partial [Gamsiella multidivaricata]|uniref:uncharacterized protein n=1 Tax=Gamsiella multidivaricata TaxID=101098 RepID=UPI002220A0D2
MYFDITYIYSGICRLVLIDRYSFTHQINFRTHLPPIIARFFLWIVRIVIAVFLFTIRCRHPS